MEYTLQDSSDDERLLRRAADDAFVHYVAKIIENWIVDGSEQPERAFSGIRKALDVRHQAIKAIEAGDI